MQRKVFRGVGAMIVKPVTHRLFHVFTRITDSQVTGFDPNRLIEVDLDRTPTRGAWDLVRVDDRGIAADRIPLPGAPSVGQLDGFHVTSIGGWRGSLAQDDLWSGCLIGGVYLEDSYFEKVRGQIDDARFRWPCDGRKTYQLTSIAYADAAENGARKGMRYHGFEAQLVRHVNRTLRLVELFDAVSNEPLGEFELDFANPLHVDDPPVVAAGEHALSAGSAVKDRGAVYIELARIAGLQISNPKLPIGLAG